MRVGDDLDLLYEAGEVQDEGLVLLLPYPEEGHDSWFRPGTSEEVVLELSRELIEGVDGGERQPTVPPSSDPAQSPIKGALATLVLHSNGLGTLSILWFTRCNCALRELVEFEENVSWSSGLRADALGVDVRCLTALPEGARSDCSESWGRLSAGCVARGRPSVSGVALVRASGAAWGCGLGYWASRVTAKTPRLSGGGVNPGSLNRRQYHPGVWEAKFLSPSKGSGSEGYGAPPEVSCVAGGASSPKLRARGRCEASIGLGGVLAVRGFFPRSVVEYLQEKTFVGGGPPNEAHPMAKLAL
ncbi:hypothetical protein GW17_00032561 [Ensete ventricosum]|nr:hypothetical protein GW17_00032561 [Ensete ventricosum]